MKTALRPLPRMKDTNKNNNGTISPTTSVTCSTPASIPSTDFLQNWDLAAMPFDSIPTPGSWFTIRTRNSGKYLSIINGALRAQEKPHSWGGFRWRCESTHGWLGFHEFTTGRYLGRRHDSCVVKALKHTEDEYFVISPQPDGGYCLLVFHQINNSMQAPQKVLRRLSCDGNGNVSLQESEGLEDVWEFCEIEKPE